MSRQFAKIGLIAFAVISFSSLNVFAQRGESSGDDGSPGDRAADNRPNNDRVLQRLRERRQRETGQPEIRRERTSNPDGANGDMQSQIHELREQVGRLTRALQQFQARMAQGPQRAAGRDFQQGRFGPRSRGNGMGRPGLREFRARGEGFGGRAGRFQGQRGWNHRGRHQMMGRRAWRHGFMQRRFMQQRFMQPRQFHRFDGRGEGRSRDGARANGRPRFGGEGGADFGGARFGGHFNPDQAEGNDGPMRHRGPSHRQQDESSGDAGGAGPGSREQGDGPRHPDNGRSRHHNPPEEQEEQ